MSVCVSECMQGGRGGGVNEEVNEGCRYGIQVRRERKEMERGGLDRCFLGRYR